MMGAGPDRRTFLAGGASLVAGATMARSVAAQHAADYAVFTELSTELKAMKAGWNRRLFTNIDTRKGNAIQGDMATGIVTVAPGGLLFALSASLVSQKFEGGGPN